MHYTRGERRLLWMVFSLIAINRVFARCHSPLRVSNTSIAIWGKWMCLKYSYLVLFRSHILHVCISFYFKLMCTSMDWVYYVMENIKEVNTSNFVLQISVINSKFLKSLLCEHCFKKTEYCFPIRLYLYVYWTQIIATLYRNHNSKVFNSKQSLYKFPT